jgi:hypothetical protein
MTSYLFITLRNNEILPINSSLLKSTGIKRVISKLLGGIYFLAMKICAKIRVYGYRISFPYNGRTTIR